MSTYSYTQTTREEVVERFDNGSKKKVITYSGVGNAEKILKVTYYYYEWCVSPYIIEEYGSKDWNGMATWDIIKTQFFKAGGASEDRTELKP